MFLLLENINVSSLGDITLLQKSFLLRDLTRPQKCFFPRDFFLRNASSLADLDAWLLV
jgi:hypothetical protein